MSKVAAICGMEQHHAARQEFQHEENCLEKYQWDPVYKQVRQHFGVDLPLRADVAVPTNLGKHVVLTLTMAREPDLAHAGYSSFTYLQIRHASCPPLASAKTWLNMLYEYVMSTDLGGQVAHSMSNCRK